MKDALKRIIPKKLWAAARTAWIKVSHAAERFGPQTKTVDYCGFRLFYNRGNSIIERLKHEPVFEQELCAAIERDLKKLDAPVLLDIGANIGLVSLRVLSEVPQAKVFAFEPGPAQASMLERTIAANALEERLVLNRAALSDSAGKRTFYIHPNRDMSKDGLRDTGRGEGARPIEVDAVTLDDWWRDAGSPRIDVVKIDTEGAELFVLRGAGHFLATAKPVLYLEIENRNLRAYPYAAEDILAFLLGAGYGVSTLRGERASRENFSALLARTDTFRASPDEDRIFE